MDGTGGLAKLRSGKAIVNVGDVDLRVRHMPVPLVFTLDELTVVGIYVYKVYGTIVNWSQTVLV